MWMKLVLHWPSQTAVLGRLYGKCHKIDANRGKRLNVIGAMLSTGELFSVALWQTTNSMIFTGFLGLLMNYVGKPLTVILDNASFHKEKAVQPMLKVLAQKGLRLYFLPPYSPELNRIEKFWHKVKYELMEINYLAAELRGMSSCQEFLHEAKLRGICPIEIQNAKYQNS
jgi:transposase